MVITKNTLIVDNDDYLFFLHVSNYKHDNGMKLWGYVWWT
jgi:hypothetical protein